MIRAALLFLLLGGVARAEDYALPAPPPGPRLDYSADQVDFDSDHQLLHLRGQVILNESTWTVKGKELWIDTENRRGRSEGPLLVEDGISAVYGESGEFDFVNHTGRLQRTSAGHADWRIHAREAKVGENRRLDYLGGEFTSCGAKPPHYHFLASRITVKPKKHMIARNVLFYLGDVPIFYLPFLYKSLSPRHYLRWKTQPGLDRRNGPFVKNTLTTDHGDTLYSKLYADYYTKQGAGLGGELHRRDGEDSRGALFGYTIKETSTGDRRWAMLGQQYQALFSSTSFQGRLQLQSDADFNNNYARSNSFRVTPELVNGGAFTHRFAQATAGVVNATIRTQHQYGSTRIWAEDAPPTPLYNDGGIVPGLPVEPAERTYATGLSPLIYFEEPTIAKVQIPDGFDNRSSPLVGSLRMRRRPGGPVRPRVDESRCAPRSDAARLG